MTRLLAALMALSFGAGPALADRVSVLVFDASGSMWNRVEGEKTRIEVARDVMGDYFASRDGALPLSVIAYGHNRRGDCSDIEVIAPMGRAAPDALESRLRALMPRGMTPLTDALATARDQIPPTAEAADIILVTDGLETCDGDPCALATSLAAEGVDIRAHVVGFGMTRAEVDALACITDQTGGMLFQTNSGAELADALREVSAAPPPAPEPEPAPAPEAAFDIGDKAEAGFTYRIGWRGEARFIDEMGFVLQGAEFAHYGREYGTIGGTGTAPHNPASRTAPREPGMYDLIIRTTQGKVIARQPIEVVAPAMGFDAIGSVEPGSRVTFTFRGPEQLGERIAIARPGDPVDTLTGDWAYALHRNGKTGLKVPDAPGEYEVRYLNAGLDGVMFSRRFGIGIPFADADTTTTADLAARAAQATRGDVAQDAMPEVSATFRAGDGTLDGVSWDGIPLDEGMSPEAWAPHENTATITGQFEPGRWRITARAPGEVEFSADVEILPGQDNVFDLPVTSPDHEERDQVLMLEGAWNLWAVPPYDAPEGAAGAPMVMMRLGFTYDAQAMVFRGRFAPTEAMGGAPAGDTGPVSGEPLGFAITMDIPALSPEPFLITLERMDRGFLGRMESGANGLPVVMWRADAELPPMAELQAALYGPAPQVDAAPRVPDAPEPDPYRCADKPQGCAVTDAATGLSVVLPNGWSMAKPYFYETAGGARAAEPTTVFSAEDMGRRISVHLNPRQWSAALGPCTEIGAHRLCHATEDGFGAEFGVMAIGQSLRIDPPAPDGAVSVAPGADLDLIAGSGEFFPVIVEAPAGFEGSLSIHAPDGTEVFSTDAGTLIRAQDQALPIPEAGGVHEIRITDRDGRLRATTGVMIRDANPAAAGLIEITPSGQTRFGAGCFVSATVTRPDGPDATILAPVTAQANGRAVTGLLDPEAPLAFEIVAMGRGGQSTAPLMLGAPCEAITLSLGAVQCRTSQGDGTVTGDCPQPVRLAPMQMAQAGSTMADAIIGAAASEAEAETGNGAVHDAETKTGNAADPALIPLQLNGMAPGAFLDILLAE